MAAPAVAATPTYGCARMGAGLPSRRTSRGFERPPIACTHSSICPRRHLQREARGAILRCESSFFRARQAMATSDRFKKLVEDTRSVRATVRKLVANKRWRDAEPNRD